MTTVKSLAIIALVVGGTSLAVAQTAPTTGGSPPANVTTGPTGVPSYMPGQTAKSGHATKHRKMHMSAKSQPHKKMYMSARSRKGSKLTPAGNTKPQMKQ